MNLVNLGQTPAGLTPLLLTAAALSVRARGSP